MASANQDIYVTFVGNVTSTVQYDATSVSYTEEGPTLEEINDSMAKTHIGGAIFVGILMLIGFVGNLHVILIYSFRTKRSNHRVFILCLGVLDMVTCSIGMPFVLVQLRYPLMFYAAVVCKIMCFLIYFMCASSALLLLVIATDRYRKICVPLRKQMSETVAKVSCGIVMTVALAISWPAPVLNGYSIQHSGVGNITGVRCSTEDRFKTTKWQAYFHFLLMLLVFGAFTVLCVLYSMIGAQIVRQKTFKSTVNVSKSLPLSTSSSSKDSSGTVETSLQSKDDTHEDSGWDATKDVISTKKCSRRELKLTANDHSWKSPKKIFGAGRKKGEYAIVAENTAQKKERNKVSKEDNKTRRITFIMFMITLVFVCSFMSHLILKIVVFMKKDFLTKLSPAGLHLYNTFVWSFFITNMANPIIYGFCDTKFRQELLSFYGRLPTFHCWN